MTTVLRVLAALALLALLCVSLVPALTQWPGDMVAPFRAQLTVAALAGLAGALLLRDWRVVGLAAIVLAANLLPMTLRVIDRPVLSATAPGQPVSLVFANVLCDNDQYGRVLALVKAQDTDIFAAAETTPEWVAQLDGLRSQYPYSFAYTWPTARPWLAIQIDQVLTIGMKAGSYETLGDIGSDHYPIRARLVI